MQVLRTLAIKRIEGVVILDVKDIGLGWCS